MARLGQIFRSTVFLLCLVGLLASTSAALGAWALHTTTRVATLTASTASAAARHRRELARLVTGHRREMARTATRHRRELSRSVMRTKAKARLRRYIVAVPLVGSGAAAAFEYRDYREWQEEHPERGKRDYACEVSENSATVVDEVLQELPQRVRPSEGRVLGLLPECGAEAPEGEPLSE